MDSRRTPLMSPALSERYVLLQQTLQDHSPSRPAGQALFAAVICDDSLGIWSSSGRKVSRATP